MNFNQAAVLEAAKKYDSFYLYDEKEIIKSIDSLKSNFSGVNFLYSMKANPNPDVVKTIFSHGLGADAASLAEVLIAKEHGLSKKKIHYSAPGKSYSDIEEALEHATLIADSLNEVRIIQEIAERKEKTARIGIRINPDFTFNGEGGVAVKFGIDEEQAFAAIEEWKNMPNVKVRGIHVHSKSQELNGKTIRKYYEKVLSLAERFQDALARELEFINMGSGIGITYSPDDQPVDIEHLGSETSMMIYAFKSKMPLASVYIETGRYVVGKSGVYVSKVMDKKVSRGTTFVILKNTLNGFIRSTMSEFVGSFSQEENPKPNEPFYTCMNPFEIIPITDEKETEKVTITGNLCTAADVVATDILMPKMDVGDLVVFTNAGSYAAAITPMEFSMQEKPAEIFLNI